MTKVGSSVTTGVKEGDRVSGCVHGCRDDKTGAYAEYVVADQGLVYKIPANTTFEQAASLPIGLYTPLVSLYFILDSISLTMESRARTKIPLFWCGPVLPQLDSSISNSSRCQVTKLSRLHLPLIMQMLKSLGADAVFDYKDADVVDKVKKAAGSQGFKYAVDTISEKETVAQVAEAMAPNGQIVVQLPVESPRSDVKIHMITLYDANNEPYVMAGRKCPGSKEMHDFVLDMMPHVTQWLADGKLQFQKITVRPGGLAGVQAGFEDMKANKVRAEKLVYKIADTP